MGYKAVSYTHLDVYKRQDNGCAAVAFPDFTRGEWNVVKGYKHAYASPEEEAAAMELSLIHI